jgi:hypothetical protein
VLGSTADAASGPLPPGTAIQVRVAEADFERAMGILFPLPSIDPQPAASRRGQLSLEAPPWTCPNCGENVHFGATVCWSCGHRSPDAGPALDAQGEIEQATAADDLPRHAPGATAGAWPPLPLPPESSDEADADLAGVFRVAAPQANGKSPWRCAETPARRYEAEAPGDRAATKAWWTAIAGAVLTLLFVPVLSLYSFCVLVQLGWSQTALSARGTWRYFTALVLDGAALAWTGFVISRF